MRAQTPCRLEVRELMLFLACSRLSQRGTAAKDKNICQKLSESTDNSVPSKHAVSCGSQAS